METSREVNITNMKTHIADIIINFNFAEHRIIEENIDSGAEYFVNSILLHSEGLPQKHKIPRQRSNPSAISQDIIKS